MDQGQLHQRYDRRSGNIVLFERPGSAGRIRLVDGTRTVASWRFAEGWCFALGTQAIMPGSPSDLLFVPVALRRG